MMHRQNGQQQISFFCIMLCGVLCLWGCKENPNVDSQQVANYTIDKTFYEGPLRIRVRLSDDQMELSGLLALELSSEIDSAYEVQFPAMAETLKQFRIRSWKDLPETLSDDKKNVKTYQYQLEPLELGTCEIPAFTFTFELKKVLEDKPSQAMLTTETIWVDVTTSIPADPNALAIADIEGVVEMKTDYTRLWIGLGVVCLLAAGVAVGMAVKPKKPAQIRRTYKSAHEIAFDVLKAIAGEKLVEQRRIKEFYEKLSTCLRQYIENRFQLRAPEQTTEEFLEQLKTSDALKLEHKQKLRKFLEHCDLVKFARYQPTDDQINESLTMAEEFVEKTKSKEHLVDVTAAPQAERQVAS